MDKGTRLIHFMFDINFKLLSLYDTISATIILSKSICLSYSTKIGENTALSDSFTDETLKNKGISLSLLTIQHNIHCFKSGQWSLEYPYLILIGFYRFISNSYPKLFR
jgi:hypothetical protein